MSFKGFLPPFVVPSDLFCRSNAYNEKGLPQDVISLGYLGAYSSHFMPDFEIQDERNNVFNSKLSHCSRVVPEEATLTTTVVLPAASKLLKLTQERQSTRKSLDQQNLAITQTQTNLTETRTNLAKTQNDLMGTQATIAQTQNALMATREEQSELRKDHDLTKTVMQTSTIPLLRLDSS